MLRVVAILGVAAAAAAQDEPAAAQPSGLQIVELQAGSGPRLVPGDQAVLEYTAHLADGRVRERHLAADPARLFVAKSNPSFWEEALPLLRVGGRYRITVPPKLMWPEAAWPPDAPRDKPVRYEVAVLAAVHRPVLVKPDPERLRSDPAGFRYEVVEEGSGEPPRLEDWFEVEFSVWDEKGELVEHTPWSGQPVRTNARTVPSTFLKHGPLRMKPGARWRCEMPVSVAYGRRHPVLSEKSTTWWDVRLLRVNRALPVPAFVQPVDDELTSTASGLLYQMLVPGEGEPPAITEQVTVHYVGWLADGTVIESSYAHGRPAVLVAGEVFAGWREGLLMMAPGSTWRFVIPPALAYGKAGVPGRIPPDATVVFQVELLAVRR